MGGRKFVVAVVAVFSLLLMSLPVYAAGMYFGGVDDIGGNNTNEYDITADTEVTLNYNVLLGEISVQFELPGTANFNQNDIRTTLIMFEADDGSGKLKELVFNTKTWEADGDPAGVFNITAGGLGQPLDSLAYTLDGDDWFLSGTLDYTEIPIPGAIWLLGSGMIGLAGVGRRFRKSE